MDFPPIPPNLVWALLEIKEKPYRFVVTDAQGHRLYLVRQSAWSGIKASFEPQQPPHKAFSIKQEKWYRVFPVMAVDELGELVGSVRLHQFESGQGLMVLDLGGGEVAEIRAEVSPAQVKETFEQAVQEARQEMGWFKSQARGMEAYSAAFAQTQRRWVFTAGLRVGEFLVDRKRNRVEFRSSQQQFRGDPRLYLTAGLTALQLLATSEGGEGSGYDGSDGGDGGGD